MDEIKVHVVEFSDRRFYVMQYRDPLTGRKVSRSTRVERTGRKRERIEAERVAAQWEAELRAGAYRRPSRVTWAEFRQRYEREVLSGLAADTESKVATVFGLVEAILRPTLLRQVTAERISYFAAELRRDTATAPGRSESTIAGYLAHLKAALRWAARVGLLPQAPAVVMPKRARVSQTMKGRPITGEEFERMLDKVPDVVGEAAAASWRFYLRGLWASGLRLAESLELYWDRADKLCVDLTGPHPMLRIPAELEKGNRDRLLPMAPEFAELLAEVPPEQRTGPVFSPADKRTGQGRVRVTRVSKVISTIGRAAGVKVSADANTGRVKYASAHDLRRSFGERWAVRVMPPILQQLMRHEAIDTTLRFYVGRNAANTARVLWDAHRAATSTAKGNTLGNTRVFGDELTGESTAEATEQNTPHDNGLQQ